MGDKFIEITKWLGGGAAWLISMIITYKLGRKSKIDDIHIKKRHEYAEIMADALKKDFKERQTLLELYEKNFGHLKEIAEADEAFNRFPSLYKEMRTIIAELPNGINKLEEISRKATVYFNPAVMNDVENYISETRFSFATDGTGGLLYNTFFLSFFNNLLDQKKILKRKSLFESSIYKLRKALK